MQPLVKDLIEFLNTFDPDTPIELDKDGWMEEDIPHLNSLQLLSRRGVFQRRDDSKFGGGIVLIINN